MSKARIAKADLQDRVDDLGAALARADPSTRNEMLARLDRVVGEALRPRAVVPEARASNFEDSEDGRFDNLPV